MHFLQFDMMVTFNFPTPVKLSKLVKSHSMRERVILWKRLAIIRGLEWKLYCLPKRGNEADVSRFTLNVVETVVCVIAYLFPRECGWRLIIRYVEHA